MVHGTGKHLWTARSIKFAAKNMGDSPLHETWQVQKFQQSYLGT